MKNVNVTTRLLCLNLFVLILVSIINTTNVFAQSDTTVVVRHQENFSSDSAEIVLKSYGAVILEKAPYFSKLVVTVRPSLVDTIRRLTWVTVVEGIITAIENNDVSRLKINVDKIQSNPWSVSNPYNLTGSGVNLGIWDAGSPKFHADFTGRLTQVESNGNSCYSTQHQTHTAGTMAGDGTNSAGNGGLSLQWCGMAPKAKIFGWDMNSWSSPCTLSGAPTVPTEMLNGVTNPNIKIVVANNSWGYMGSTGPASYFGAYLGDCIDFDKLVRNSNLNIVFAAGNERGYIPPLITPLPAYPGFGTVAPPSTAKNIITVGATDNANGMTFYSGWGPTKDGRLKPDVVAYGGNATSGTGVKSTVGTTGYALMSGTSMAAPAVAGTLGLLIERYRMVWSSDPVASLLKAIVLNTAKDLFDPGPDFKSGYGEVDALSAVKTIDRKSYLTDKIAKGQVKDYPMTFCKLGTLKVMLAYSDKEFTPATSSSKVLMNDLDLELVDPSGATHLPLTLNPAIPSAVATESVNHRDNVEQVVFTNSSGTVLAGTWILRVKGFDVQPTTSQEFALVWDTTGSVCSQTTPPVCLSNCPNPINAVVNGDFELGNSGFTSELALGCNSCSSSTYCVGPLFSSKCSGWPATGGTGNFLAVDGLTANSATNSIWKESITILPTTTYTWCFSGKNIYSDTASAIVVDVYLDNTLIGTATINSNTAWLQFSGTWASGSLTGSHVLSLRQRSAGAFRDFGIDNIFFGYCPVTTPCLEMKANAACAGVDANGNQLYSITITGNNPNSAGSLFLSSIAGTLTPVTPGLLSGPFTRTVTFTDTPPSNVGTTITVNYTFLWGGPVHKVCRDSFTVLLPKCPPVIDTCCSQFMHRFLNSSVSVNTSSNGNTINLSGMVFAGASKIKRFSATIVSAHTVRKCGTTSWSAPSRVFGDIIGGGVTPAPAALQLLTIYSRQAEWGPGECLDWNNGVPLSLKMIFPAPPTGYGCVDSLIFKIRYSFTDCNCVTCDTIITYKIKRKYKIIFFPGDDKKEANGGSEVMERNIEKGEGLLAADATETSLSMKDANSGTLTIINPPAVDNDLLTIVGLEVTSLEVPLVTIKNGTSDGVLFDKSGLVGVDISPNQKGSISLGFDNSKNISKFMVGVQFMYTISGDSNINFSETAEFVARVPGGTPDVIAQDNSTKPLNVKSYALYFTNSNSNKETVYSLKLTTKSNAKILAVGPPSETGESAVLIPSHSSNNTYTITAQNNDGLGIESGETIKPIFITVAGTVNNSVDVDFETYDELNTQISTGSFTLSNPISGIKQSAGDPQSIHIETPIPNPASNTATLSFALNKYENGASLGIYDILGHQVISLFSDKSLEQGNHVVTTDVSVLSVGVYYIVLRTQAGNSTQTLTIVR